MCSAAKKQQVILCCAWNTGEERVAPLICFCGVGGVHFPNYLFILAEGTLFECLTLKSVMVLKLLCSLADKSIHLLKYRYLRYLSGTTLNFCFLGRWNILFILFP